MIVVLLLVAVSCVFSGTGNSVSFDASERYAFGSGQIDDLKVGTVSQQSLLFASEDIITKTLTPTYTLNDCVEEYLSSVLPLQTKWTCHAPAGSHSFTTPVVIPPGSKLHITGDGKAASFLIPSKGAVPGYTFAHVAAHSVFSIENSMVNIIGVDITVSSAAATSGIKTIISAHVNSQVLVTECQLKQPFIDVYELISFPHGGSLIMTSSRYEGRSGLSMRNGGLTLTNVEANTYFYSVYALLSDCFIDTITMESQEWDILVFEKSHTSLRNLVLTGNSVQSCISSKDSHLYLYKSFSLTGCTFHNERSRVFVSDTEAGDTRSISAPENKHAITLYNGAQLDFFGELSVSTTTAGYACILLSGHSHGVFFATSTITTSTCINSLHVVTMSSVSRILGGTITPDTSVIDSSSLQT
eukprot:TRINITY_DN41997_c0_g1_i1.p1 TRINITY_DN41997_c0_g1~~TRINITY_DN41997_c0_g1_i1.p1  ORF type:complete len:414 (-),score=13.36 TRINITY_DN41997_c0_g1_i1:144-1385(-)